MISTLTVVTRDKVMLPVVKNQTRKVMRAIQHHRHKPTRDAIGQILNRRFGVLGRLHQLHNLGQQRIFANPRCPKLKTPRLVDRGTDHLVPWAFSDGHGFPCHHRFVNGGLPLNYLTIHRNLFPRAHQHDISHGHRLNRNIHGLPLAHDSGRFGLRPHQMANGV